MDTTNATAIVANGIDISLSYGMYQVGVIFASILFGISTMQVYLYYWHYFDIDKWWLKSLVGAMWAMDLTNLVLIIRGEWNAEVLKWGKLSELLKSQGPAVTHSDVEAVVVVIVQFYLIRRVYLLLTHKSWFDWVVLAILPVLSVWQIVGDICYQVIGLGQSLAVLASTREVGINISMRAAAAAVDLTVTAYMVRILAGQRSGGLRQTRRMIGRLLVVIVNTGLFTAMIAVGCLVALATRPNDLYWLIFEFPICTAYFSCFLANLNSRNFVRGPAHAGPAVIDSTFHAAVPSAFRDRERGSISEAATAAGGSGYGRYSVSGVAGKYHAVHERTTQRSSAFGTETLAPSVGSPVASVPGSEWTERSGATHTDELEHKVSINIHTDRIVSPDDSRVDVAKAEYAV